MAEQEVLSSLLMDRDGPLGNSVDRFLRRSLHVKVGNSSADAIPVYVVDGEPGDPIFWDTEDTTDPGVDKEILSGTFSTSTSLSTLSVSCRVESKISLLVDNVLVASLRSGASQPNPMFTWNPRRVFPAGSVFKVIIKSRQGSSISDCEAFLMALQQT